MSAPRSRIALLGSVTSSRRTLQGLLRHRAQIVGVGGLSPRLASRVSGYVRLDDLAEAAGASFFEFSRINDEHTVEAIRAIDVDVLFIVGLSQLVRPEVLGLPRKGCIGFHPTLLPQGRGRAPVAWLTLDRRPGAATFFLMEEGMDSGPIFVQEPFVVAADDYASDVLAKVEEAIDRALDRWLPNLLSGGWAPLAQRGEEATYLGRRAPVDGLIDWRRPAGEIRDLVRASSRPHPGAYTFVSDRRLTVWRAGIDAKTVHRGVEGRVLAHQPGTGWLVQAGDRPLWLAEVELEAGGDVGVVLRPGVKLGYDVEPEIQALKRRVDELEGRIAKLTVPTEP